MRQAFLPCLCLAAASLSAQTYAYLPATATPTGELSSYSLVPFMQPNARLQLFYDAAEVASTGIANQLSLRFDGPIPQVGAPGPFTISRLRIRLDTSSVAAPGAEFATNVTKLCEWCDFREWCPAHGGDIGNAKPEASVRVQLRRRQVGLPESS